MPADSRAIAYSNRSQCAYDYYDPDICGFDNSCAANGVRTWDGVICKSSSDCELVGLSNSYIISHIKYRYTICPLISDSGTSDYLDNDVDGQDNPKEYCKGRGWTSLEFDGVICGTFDDEPSSRAVAYGDSWILEESGYTCEDPGTCGYDDACGDYATGDQWDGAVCRR